MHWYEFRTIERGPPPERTLRQSDIQQLSFDNLEQAMAEAMKRDRFLGDAGYVAVYDDHHVKVWPIK
jgi:hypothetical protein